MVASTVLEIIRVMVNSGNAKPVRTRGIAVVAAEAWSRGSRHGCRGVHDSKIRSAAHQRMPLPAMASADHSRSSSGLTKCTPPVALDQPCKEIGRASCRERVCQYV